MEDNIEAYDLNKLKEIGGSSYNHDGQVVRTPHNGANGGWLFLGDDYGEYSPVDALVMNIVEYPANFNISGEITKVEIVSTRYGSDIVRVTSTYDGEETVDEIEYEHLSVEVIVNHKTKFEIHKKSA